MQGLETQKAFPFSLDDLQSWTVRHLDGRIVRYVLSEDRRPTSTHTGTNTTTNMQTKSTTSLGAYCSHVPGDIPSAEFDSTIREAGLLRLWVAGMSGARQTKDTFDFVIDGGDVITLWGKDGAILTGDEALSGLLAPYVTKHRPTRVLKIDWDDRKAPGVSPEFWVELNKELSGDVMTCCMGGHGRSGTAFVCLLLVNSPDYDAMDAIVHLRAVHCPRAIESIEQWNYINTVAEHLGRKANAKEAMAITDYGKVFAESKKPTAVANRTRIIAEVKAAEAKKTN